MKRLVAFLFATLVPVTTAPAAGDTMFDRDLALALRYARECPGLAIDQRRAVELAAQVRASTPSMLAGVGESSETFARVPAPAPSPAPELPPPSEEAQCDVALKLFGPEGERIRGLLVKQSGTPQ